MTIFAGIRCQGLAAMAVLLATLSGCGSAACPAGAGQPMQIYTLYFGRSVTGRGPVSEQEWHDFRNQVITPVLPAGYTELDGQGAWMNPHTHVTVTEATKILVVAMPDTAVSLDAINRVRSSWQHRFHQYVVGMTVQFGCGSFAAPEAPK